MSAVIFRFFGTGQLQNVTGESISIRARKQLALLAYLLIERGHAHSRDSLMTLFWGEHDTGTARNNLRVTLSRVRKLLADRDSADTSDDISLILANQFDVQINPDADYWLDVAELELLLQQTKTHAHASRAECAECQPLLEKAVELYQSEFLAGLSLDDCPAFEEWLFMQRERQHLLVLDGYADLANFAESSGDKSGNFDAVSHFVRRQIELDPLRESAYRQQMRIFAKVGERSQAVALFDRCQSILSTELGVDPEPETIALLEQILSQEIRKQEAQEPKHATHLAINNSNDVEPTETQPQLLTQTQLIHNLPQQLTPFIGREEEIEALHKRLADPSYRLISVVGPGGIGKSRLALQAATKHLNNYADGVFFVSLAQLQSSHSIPEAIAKALGFVFNDGVKNMVQELIGMLETKHLLLVLDNFEHLMDGVDLLLTLLQHLPHITLLVTSRERLQVQAEDLFILPGLSFPTKIDDPGAGGYSAVRLFVDRAHRLDKGFKLTPERLPHLVEICQTLEGHPLGIELAATWIRDLSCDEIAREVANGFDLLESAQHGINPQHRSLGTIFDSSWQLLSPAEQQILARLSLFRGGFTTKSAKAVANASSPVIAQLCYKSLLRNVGSQRYEMHELVRQFAAEQLAELNAELVNETYTAHCHYFLTMVAEHGALLHGSGAKAASAILRIELDNIRLSWQWAIQRDEHEQLSDALQGLGRFYQFVGLYNEGERLFLDAANYYQEIDSQPLLRRKLVSELMLEVAILQARQKQFVRSNASFQCALQRSDDNRTLALGYIEWGRLLARQANYQESRDTIQRGLSIARQSQLMELEAAALAGLGYIDFQLEDYPAAKRQLDAAREIFEQTDNQTNLIDVCSLLYSVSACQNNIADAIAYVASMEEIVEAIADRKGAAQVAHCRSNIYNPLGMYPEAIQAATSGLELIREIGDREYESFILHMLCDSYRSLDKLDDAKQAGERSLSLAEAHESPLAIAFALTYLAATQAELGLVEQACNSYRRACTLFKEMRQPTTALEPQAALAHLLLEMGEQESAVTIVEEILAFLNGEPVMGVDHPLRVYWNCYAVLAAAGDQRADIILYRGHNLLLEIKDKLTDRSMIDAFVSADAANHNILAAIKERTETPASCLSSTLNSNHVKLRGGRKTSRLMVGRSRELETIAAMLQNSTVSLLTLTGLGGVGKTMLAMEVAHQLETQFVDGVYFVPLASIGADKMQLIGAIAQLFNLQVGAGNEPEEPLQTYLASRNLLLVLDNFEHLVGEAELLNQIQEHAPGVTLLLTSRVRLNLSSEVIYSLSGLEVPPIGWGGAGETQSSDPESLEEGDGVASYSAVELFVNAAKRQQPAFSIRPENAAAIAQICHLVAGFPLGLELAAAWTRMLDCDEIVTELEKSLDLLSSKATDWPERQRTIRGVLEYTWQTLTAEEQLSLMHVTCFRGGFDRTAAVAVAQTSLITLADFMDKSLLQRTETGRYVLHEIVRQFAMGKLVQLKKVLAQNEDESKSHLLLGGFDPAGFASTDLKSLTDLASTHSSYYLRQLDEKGELLDGPESKEWLPQLRMDDDNIQQAYRYAVEKGPIEVLREKVSAVIPYLHVTGRNLECSQMIGVALERLQKYFGLHTLEIEEIATIIDDGPQQALCETLSWLLIRQATTFNRTGKYHQTIALAQTAISVAGSLELPEQLIEAHIAWGGALSYMSDSSAYQPLEQALEIARLEKMIKQEATILGMLGLHYFKESQLEEAHAYYEQTLRIARQTQNWQLEGLYLVSLGWLQERMGAFERAKSSHEDGYAICQQMDYPTGEARALQGMGIVAIAQWDLHQAAQIHSDAIALAKQLNDRQREAANGYFLGRAFFLSGYSTKAREHLDRTVKISREINDHLNEGLALSHLGYVETVWGDESRAEQYLNQALEIGAKLENIETMAAAHQGLGWLRLQQADPVAAKAHFEQELQLKQRWEQLYAIIDPQTGLVQAALDQGQNDRAEELCDPIFAFLETDSLHGSTRLGHSFFVCYQLLANQQSAEASTMLQRARTHLQRVATRFPSKEKQKLFLRVPIHQRILGTA